MGNADSHRGLRRLIGALTSGALLMQSALVPAAIAGPVKVPHSFTDSSLLSRLAPYAIVDTTRVQPDRPTIFLLRDIHAHEEAQRNASAVLTELLAGGAAARVGVEGTSGPLDFSAYRALPRQDLVRRIASDLLSRSQIGALAHAMLTGGPRFASVEVIGLEDPMAYRANIAAYRAAAGARNGAERVIRRALAGVDERAERALRRKILSIYRARRAYDEGRRPLAVYLAWLRAAGAELAPPAAALVEAHRLERSIDFSKAERERDALLSRLATRPPEGLRRLSRLGRDVASRRRGALEFYREVDAQARAAGLNGPRAAFDAYLRYLELCDGLDAVAAFNAIPAAEHSALDRLGAGAGARRLFHQARLLTLAERLVDFSLTPEEWAELRRGAPGLLDAFQAFYRSAERRDEIFLRNFDPGDGGILIAGGFHTPGLVRRLLERDLSVVVLTPRITKVGGRDGEVYLGEFFQARSLIDRLFSGTTLFLGLPEGLGTVWPQPVAARAETAATFARLYADAGGDAADLAPFVPTSERLAGVLPDHVYFIPAGVAFVAVAAGGAFLGINATAALISASLAGALALAPLAQPFLDRHAAIAVRARELFGLSPDDYLRRLERRFWAMGAVTIAASAFGFWSAPAWIAPAISFAAGQAAGLFLHAAGNLLLLVPASSAVGSKAGALKESIVPINLMDVGAYADGGDIRYRNSLQQARRLLPGLAKLGFGAVYLYGGLWAMGAISREAHNVPSAGGHTIVSENGRSFVRVHGYLTRGAREQKRADGRVFKDDNGNPFSVRDTALLNTFLSGDVREDLEAFIDLLPDYRAEWLTARGNVERERTLMERIEVNEPDHPLVRMRRERVEGEVRAFIQEARDLGIEVICDFIPWLDPGAITADNYRQTFYRELPDEFQQQWADVKTPEQERALIDRIFHHPAFGAYMVARINEHGRERLILINHFTPGGKNVDQVILNIHHPDVQRYYVSRFERMMDLGFSGGRIDLSFRLLEQEMAPYFHQNHAVRPHDGPDQPLWHVLEEVKAIAARRKIPFRILAEVYNNPPEQYRDNFVQYWGANERRGPLVDQLYYKDALETFLQIGVGRWSAQYLWNALDYPRRMNGRLVPFTANFDEHSLNQLGGPGRWAFLATMLILAHAGMPAMIDVREMLFHFGQMIPVVGPDHPVVTEKELRERMESSLADLLERSDVAALLRAIPVLNRSAGIQWLSNSAEERYISLGAQTVDGEWLVALTDFGRPTGQSVVTTVPDGFVQDAGLPRHHDGLLNRRLADSGYRLVNFSSGESWPLNIFWDAGSNQHRLLLPSIFIEGPNVFILHRDTGNGRYPDGGSSSPPAAWPQPAPAIGPNGIKRLGARPSGGPGRSPEPNTVHVFEVNAKNLDEAELWLRGPRGALDRIVLIAAPSVERRLSAAGPGTVVARADALNEDGSLNFARAVELAAERWGADAARSFSSSTRLEILADSPHWSVPETVVHIGDELIDLAAFDIRIRYAGYLLDLLAAFGETRRVNETFSLLAYIAARRSA